MMFVRLLLLLTSVSLIAYTEPKHSLVNEESISNSLLCFFNPPSDWEMTDPTKLSPHVQIAFAKPKSSGFCPSINLAVEPTAVSLPDYLKAIRAIHEQDRNNEWRLLGKVHTAAGVAQLTQIDLLSEWGPIRMLQLILLKSGSAYILTAAALKEEFSKFYKEIQNTFRSFTLTTDLIQAITQLEKKELLKEKKRLLFEKIGALPQDKPFETLLKDPAWIAFEKEVAIHTPELGAYWQLLMLKEVQQELFSLNKKMLAQLPEKASP